jgi:cellulose synthase/poly-beta-1,6-N-acetylglucosamine synthase-like glycosyltransferase
VNAIVMTALWWACTASAAYLLTLSAIFLLMVLVAAVEGRIRARQSRNEDFDTLRESPFTIPVSIIAPAYNEAVCITQAVSSMLALSYPEYEVIVVNDGSTDATLDTLIANFDLKPIGTFHRRTLDATPIRQLYRGRDPRLLVIDKPNGGKADSLNCGINLARYRYICCVDGDTVYFPDALLKGMRLAVQNPAEVIGITSQVAISARPEDMRLPDGRLRVDRNPLLAYQWLDYLRSFMANRLAWSRGNYMLCAVGAFMIWRKDVVLELGGLSSNFTCEDIEFTFRVHEHFRRRKLPYRILSLPDIVGVTEGPNSIARLISQRARWQRVIAETVWHYRHMFGNVRYGTVGCLGVPYYVLGEVLSPIFQALSVIVIVIGSVMGLVGWREVVQALLILGCGSAMLANASVFLQERHTRTFTRPDVRFMLILGPLELFFYRPIVFWAQFKGMIECLRGERGWNKFARNTRTAA